MSAIQWLRYKFKNLFLIEQEGDAKNGIEWHSGFQPLMTGALPFSECNERLSFVAIQRPTGAYAIMLR